MRLWAIQKATFEIEMASVPDTAGSAPIRAALAFRKLADQSQTLQLLQRYDTAYERQYNRAFNILMKLQASNPAPLPDVPLPNLPVESGTFASHPPAVIILRNEANFPINPNPDSHRESNGLVQTDPDPTPNHPTSSVNLKL
jgi:hypothetical protein